MRHWSLSSSARLYELCASDVYDAAVKCLHVLQGEMKIFVAKGVVTVLR
jgi:hypothetical protein